MGVTHDDEAGNVSYTTTNNLAPVKPGSLPENYQAAKLAIKELDRVDECKAWSDKAAALASYARQANDLELRQMAERIHVRAVRRQGQLQKELESRPGTRTDLQPSGGTPTRSQIIRAAGISKDQQNTATRVANVPEDEFEKAVESSAPPTVTELAERGKRRRKPKVKTPEVVPAPVSEPEPASDRPVGMAEYLDAADRAESEQPVTPTPAPIKSDLPTLPPPSKALARAWSMSATDAKLGFVHVYRDELQGLLTRLAGRLV